MWKEDYTYITRKSDCALVYYLPFYFHPYFIAKAIEEDFKIEDCYDLLYITSFLLVDDDKAEERRRTLEGTSRPIASVKNRDQFTEILLKFTKVNLAKMDLEEGLKDDNA
jgi:endo-1,4-beta-D-glucanase Y